MSFPRVSQTMLCRVGVALLLTGGGWWLAVGQVAGVSLGSSGQTSLAPSSSLVNPYTVRGKVLNGVDGSGVARALVTLSSRKVLTDPQGNFQFQGFTLANGNVTVTKPGFSTSPDGSQLARGLSSPDLTAPVVLRLYPNAVVAGVVTGRDALPVAGVQVRLVAASLDVAGLRWGQAGSSTTDSHGEYRFNPPPGRYRVTVGYRANERDTGEVVLPVSFPEISSTDKANFFLVGSGQERRIDLRARTGPGYPVLIKTSSPSARGFRFTVMTGSGDSFSPAPEAGENGEYELTLPVGTYTVKGHLDAVDVTQEGQARVTVSTKVGAAVPLQLAPLTSLPLEIAVDNAVPMTSSMGVAIQQPNAGQFGLRLRNEKNVGEAGDADINLTFARGQAGTAQQAEFRVPPGRYRLEGNNGGAWHVESATMGQTNLIGGEVVIGPGAAGMPIRLVVDNRVGIVSGSVRMPDTVANAWVYLIAQTPTLAVANAVVVSSAGTFSTRASIGKYHLLALDHQLHIDLRDPEVVKEFSTAMQDVEITSGATATVQLDLAREKGGTE